MTFSISPVHMYIHSKRSVAFVRSTYFHTLSPLFCVEVFAEHTKNKIWVEYKSLSLCFFKQSTA